MKKNSKCAMCKGHLEGYSVSTEYYSLIEDNHEIGNLEGFVCHRCAIKQSKINKLYHLSNHCNIINEFTPRVPKNRASGEDEKTPRISLSSTIEGCLTAVPWGNSKMEELYWGGYDNTFLIRVYEFDICDIGIENLIPPEYLYFSDLVRDAYITKEYWYTSKILKPSRTYLIEITHDYEESEDYVKCEKMMNLIRSDRKREEPEEDYDEIIEGCFSKIENVKYTIIPEKRRSGLFRLNHEIVGVNMLDAREIQIDMLDIYPLEETSVELVKRNDAIYIVGDVDTRWTGDLDYSGEIDTDKIIDYFNQNLSIGEIINNTERMI